MLTGRTSVRQGPFGKLSLAASAGIEPAGEDDFSSNAEHGRDCSRRRQTRFGEATLEIPQGFGRDDFESVGVLLGQLL